MATKKKTTTKKMKPMNCHQYHFQFNVDLHTSLLMIAVGILIYLTLTK